MTSITVGNVPEEMRLAIQVDVAQHVRDIGAKMHDIIESAVKPDPRLKLGSLIAETGREAKLTDEELGILAGLRDQALARVVSFE